MTHVLAERTAPRDRLADHLPALRARLEHQRRFRREHVAALDAILEDATVITNAADRARHEVTVKVAAAARQALLDIDAALKLMDNGGYGRCHACHAGIPMRLLLAIPTSRLCLNCCHLLTQAHGQHRTHGRRSHATSGPSRRHPAVSKRRQSLALLVAGNVCSAAGTSRRELPLGVQTTLGADAIEPAGRVAALVRPVVWAGTSHDDDPSRSASTVA